MALSGKLKAGCSSAALILLITLVPQMAMAQQNGADIESVVVTGTNIRGVAPVGSHVTSVTEQDIQSIAPVSVSSVLATLPQLSSANTAGQGENSYTFYSPNIHNLAASASNSTLVVVDGMRIPGGGPQWSEADPNIIPVVALQRVEVLADGASSVYGSDAVAGVVNFITRKSFDGLQVDLQGGGGDAYSAADADLLWGTHWTGGNVMFAASYSFGSNIAAADRPFLSRGDYTSLGGNNQQQTNCPVASIHPLTPAAGAGNSYWYQGPGDAAGYPNTQPARPCNNEIYGDVIPQSQRTNGMLRVNQDFLGGRLNVTETMIYNDLHTNQQNTPGTITATAYGAGTGLAGQQNPFFQAPAGAPGTTSETVAWVDTLSPLPRLQTSEDVIYNRVNATFNIAGDWHFDVDWVIGQNTYDDSTVNGFCASCAYLALNGTALANGSTTTTDVSGRDVIALNLPLTTANALDVWDPAASNKTSAAVLRSLSSYNSLLHIANVTNQLRGSFEGSLFDMPAGAVHGAIGGEIYTQHIVQNNVTANNTGPSSSGAAFQRYHYSRVVQSAFAEIQIPVVSPQMDVPLIQNLAVDISGRYDSFSDVGSTANPKFSADWTVVDGLKLRGNYSTSFVAPPLQSIGDPTLGYMYSGGAAVGGQLDNIPVKNFPTIAQIPGAVCTGSGLPASTGCPFVTVGQTSGVNGDQGLERQLGGGIDNVKPETGLAWSLGADFNPAFLPGFLASVTLWNNTFKGAVNAAHIQQTVNNPALFKFFTVCPSGCSQAQINAFTNVANGATTGQLPAGPIYYLWAHDETNFLYLKVQGVDLDVSYNYDAGDLGIFHASDYATIFTKFDEGYDGKSYFSIMNTSGFNGTFSSVQWNTRLNLGWVLNQWAVDFFINYTPGYRNWNSTSVNPIITNAVGIPSGGGDIVKSWTTLDLNLAYTFLKGTLSGDQFYIHVDNLFNTDPPFINTTANGAGASSGAAFGFNAFNASPVGRTVMAGIRASL